MPGNQPTEVEVLPLFAYALGCNRGTAKAVVATPKWKTKQRLENMTTSNGEQVDSTVHSPQEE